MKATFSASLITFLAILLIDCGGRSDTHIRESVEYLIEEDSSAVAPVDAHYGKVQHFYRQREFRPAWVSTGGPDERLHGLIEALCEADRVGLNPAEYVDDDLHAHVTRAFRAFDEEIDDDSTRAHRLAVLDVAVTATVMRYASDVVTGRVDPRELGRGWHTPVYEADLSNVFSDTTTAASLRGLSRRKARMHAQYGALLGALERYQQIADRGGWPKVEAGEPLSVGDSNRRVATVIRHLAATGDLDSSLVPEASDSARYTDSVAGGVERFQERHGIEVDGVAGENVISKMNVPVDERIRQIELNLERWRWIPSQLGSRYLYVNVPAFELHAIEDGEEVLSMAVVVGEEYDDSATPVFSDTMEYVVFNPYWNVPHSIATEEILPLAREDPDYLDQNRYEIATSWRDDAEVVPPSQGALDRVEAEQYRIRQRPGPDNALGTIKFMFPNDFNIYLHDTPEDYLFERAQRAYSHGCIRVERPVELADFVLTSDEWTTDAIEAGIRDGERSTEYLEDPVPVYILYWTAFVDDEDRVHFREDIYGNDAVLHEALERRASEAAAASCDRLVERLSE